MVRSASLLSSFALAAACSATAPVGGGNGGAGNGGGNGGGIVFGGFGGTGGGTFIPPNCEGVDPGIDNDGDGWTGADGDCNDCTAVMNPGAFDYPGNGADEDCNGIPDDEPAGCDTGLAIDSNDPLDGVRAMDICRQSDGQSWGVVSASFTHSDGSTPLSGDSQLGHGILNGLGTNIHVQKGASFLALSSGTARDPDDPGYQSVGGFEKDFNVCFSFTGEALPPGYSPPEPAQCPGASGNQAFDSAALKVKLRTPTNAKSLNFKINFLTYEFPYYVCSNYNDLYATLMNPKPSTTGDQNISFDAQGNVISVNAGFLEACDPQVANGISFACALGYDQLLGTGFDEQTGNPRGSAGTGWLQTSAPIEDPGGEIDLMFVIWDAGDCILDSTAVIDDFQWSLEDTPTGTVPVPVPN